MFSALLEDIKKSFSQVTLGEEYTLLEEEFFDDRYMHFDQIYPEFFLATKLTPEQLVNPYWSESGKKVALEAIKSRKKVENPYPSWMEIPFEYLNEYHAVLFLSSKAFQFYLPAAMIILLQRVEEKLEIDFFDGFEYVLLRHPDKYIDLFNNEQLSCVSDFLDFYMTEPYISSLNIFDIDDFLNVQNLIFDKIAANKS